MEAARRRGESVPRGVSQERLDQLEITKYKRPPKEKGTGAPSASPTDGDEQSMNEDLCPICLVSFAMKMVEPMSTLFEMLTCATCSD